MTLQPSCLTSLQQYGGGSSIPPNSFHPPSVFAACCVFQVYFFLLLDIFQLSAQPDGYFSWPYVPPSPVPITYTHTHTSQSIYTEKRRENPVAAPPLFDAPQRRENTHPTDDQQSYKNSFFPVFFSKFRDFFLFLLLPCSTPADCPAN